MAGRVGSKILAMYFVCFLEIAFVIKIEPCLHRRNNRRNRGSWSPNLKVGGPAWGPTMYWSPNFSAVVFKKQEISQQVVTRMQDLASEFSKFFPGLITAGGATPFRTQHPARPLTGRGALGPKPWSP